MPNRVGNEAVERWRLCTPVVRHVVLLLIFDVVPLDWFCTRR